MENKDNITLEDYAFVQKIMKRIQTIQSYYKVHGNDYDWFEKNSDEKSEKLTKKDKCNFENQIGKNN